MIEDGVIGHGIGEVDGHVICDDLLRFRVERDPLLLVIFLAGFIEYRIDLGIAVLLGIRPD